MHERAIDVVDQKIAYTETTGTGQPVVLVHGNSSSARTWQALLAGPFGKRFRCLALDLPGHGRSAPSADSGVYSLPGYAEVLTEFAQTTDAADAIFVGWSLGGHIVLEAAPGLPDATGFLVFGTPPVGAPAQLADAFLPNAAMKVGFTANVDAAAALSFAESLVAPGSSLPLEEFVAEILSTDGAARAGLFSSIGSRRFADEVEIVARLTRPLAILHGEDEQLVSLEYLRTLAAPTLWRGRVHVLAGVGHAAHLEAPGEFADLLTRFLDDVS